MISYLIDINVWLALSVKDSPYSASAYKWFEKLPVNKARLLFCRITQLGFVRMLTDEMVMGERVVTVAGALHVFDRWCEDPRVEFVPEPKGVEASLRSVLTGLAKKSVTKAIMDAYLVGFAEAEKATLVTFDIALCKMAARRKTSHLHLSSRRSN